MSSGGPADHTPGLALGAEFSAPSRAEWREQVAAALRKTGQLSKTSSADEDGPQAPEELLASTTYDGLTIHPLYTHSPDTAESAATTEAAGYPGASPFTRGARAQGCVTNGWDIRQYHGNPDPAEANREILADLNGGVSALWLRLGPSGLPISALGDALADVHLDLAGIVLDADEHAGEAADAYLALAHERGVRPSDLSGSLGVDPLGLRARTGRDSDREPAVSLAQRCTERYPGLRALVVDGLPYHQAGGSDAQEIGCSLAAAVTYLRWLTDSGMDVDSAATQLEFRYAGTVDQFGTIAKLRTARRLWDEVTRACGVTESWRAQRQHVVTSPSMLTRRDPWVNLLRNTIATVSAGVGGAQSVSTLPFDAAIGLPDEFSRRLARNTQAVLLEESRLSQVIDPLGGSWYLETRGEELAGAAWAWFQEIEAAGGLPAALDSGLVTDRLAETWQARLTEVAHRRDPITGVTEFPDLEEPVLPRTPAPEQPGGGLPRHRYAEDYERLRDAADVRLAETGNRPSVWLATLGPLATYTARASFARNLFSAGGLATPEAGATESTADVVAAYSGASDAPVSPVVCLCSTDKIYAERAAETARELKQAGAEYVLLAGKLSELPDGVDGFVFSGCDALGVLHDVHDKLGVTS